MNCENDDTCFKTISDCLFRGITVLLFSFYIYLSLQYLNYPVDCLWHHNNMDPLQVALITYSNNATVEWTLAGKENKNLNTLKNAIMDVQQIGSFTNTVEAMEAAITKVFGQKGDRYPFILFTCY